VAFGLANIFAVIPITPGGLGIVEGIYIPTLVGFGLNRRQATLGVASYRLAQYWLPILLGAIMYLSLRVGPWSIVRRDRLDRLRDIARRETAESERRIEFTLRQWERNRTGSLPPLDATGLIPSGQRIDPGALEALDPDGDEDDASAADGEAGYPGPTHRRGPGDGPTGNVPGR
jgi:hypothetical protein